MLTGPSYTVYSVHMKKVRSLDPALPLLVECDIRTFFSTLCLSVYWTVE